jgi:hypothetical protein
MGNWGMNVQPFRHERNTWYQWIKKKELNRRSEAFNGFFIGFSFFAG